jgi:hypothetical protein
MPATCKGAERWTMSGGKETGTDARLVCGSTHNLGLVRVDLNGLHGVAELLSETSLDLYKTGTRKDEKE